VRDFGPDLRRSDADEMTQRNVQEEEEEEESARSSSFCRLRENIKSITKSLIE
jgi:hypothetical protein